MTAYRCTDDDGQLHHYLDRLVSAVAQTRSDYASSDDATLCSLRTVTPLIPMASQGGMLMAGMKVDLGDEPSRHQLS